ncbi:MAG TPA: hypothetical protein PKD55_11600 [Bellilinea sp.]|nr:hypothetical protein [Bellilinea sp.]
MSESHQFISIIALAGVIVLLLVTLGQVSSVFGQTPPPITYVANTSAECNGNTPCETNLQTAVDSGTPEVRIVGDYIVGATVSVTDVRLLKITAEGQAKLISDATNCADPLLSLKSAVTVSDLTLSGVCGSTPRPLILVSGGGTPISEYLTLTNGATAVEIAADAGATTIRFSHFEGNSGFAIKKAPSASTLNAYGNNFINNNGTNTQVDCGGPKKVDHNFWGPNKLPSQSTINCSPSDSYRLGAAVLKKTTGAGVQGEVNTVGDVPVDYFGQSLTLLALNSNTNIVAVNHGSGSPENEPFTGGTAASLKACSNYYDIFLAPGATVPNEINLSIKYSACQTEIATACGSSVSIPLVWLEPISVPWTWKTMGASGATASCDTANAKLSAKITSMGTLNPSDFNYLPVGVGLPITAASTVTLSAAPTTSSITINWTDSQPDATKTYYVLRSSTSTGGFTRLNSPALASTATTFPDNSVVPGVTYYYAIEMVTTSGSVFSPSIQVTAAAPTPTATSTNTATFTPTQTPTDTTTPTNTPSITLSPTNTHTLTNTPITPSPTVGTPKPAELTQTALPLTQTAFSRTQTAVASPPTPTPNEQTQTASALIQTAVVQTQTAAASFQTAVAQTRTSQALTRTSMPTNTRYPTSTRVFRYVTYTPYPTRTPFAARTATKTRTLSSFARTATEAWSSASGTRTPIGAIGSVTPTGEGVNGAYPAGSLTATILPTQTPTPTPARQIVNNSARRVLPWLFWLLLAEAGILTGLYFYLRSKNLLPAFLLPKKRRDSEDADDQPPPPIN